MGHFRGTFHLGRSHRFAESGSELQVHGYPQAGRIGSHTPSREEIAELAYRYWEERGRTHGFDREDWLRAERELWRRAR